MQREVVGVTGRSGRRESGARVAGQARRGRGPAAGRPQGNEIPSFAPWLDGLDPQGAAVTADALRRCAPISKQMSADYAEAPEGLPQGLAQSSNDLAITVFMISDVPPYMRVTRALA